MQLWLLVCVFLLKMTVDASFVSHRLARQVVFPQASSPDDSCTTPTEKSGTCIPVLTCRSLIQARNMDLMRKSMCGFEGKAPRVCCPVIDDDDLIIEPEPSPPKMGRGLEHNSEPLPSFSNETFNNSKADASQEFNSPSKEGRRTGTSVFPSECGRTLVTFRRIVGGQESAIGAWPWMALIYYVRRSGNSAECGGALITSKHVLTAAHCVVSSRRGTTMSPKKFLVRLGEHDLDSDRETSPVDCSVKSVIKFPEFDPKTFQNDVAILVLSSSVQYGRHISPICLPFHVFRGDLTNRKAFTAGWGSISYGGRASSRLQEVQLRIWDNSHCKEVFKSLVPINNANMCAGDGDKDACRGDSGGPLMLANSDGRFYAIGIVSFGKKCAEPGIPGVYARISNFLDWIEQQVENFK